MIFIAIIALAAASSYLLSGLLRYNARRWGLIDIPNDRSSHQTPVPRGGGIAIALVFLTLLPLLQYTLDSSNALFLALYPTCAIIALLGFIDDRGHLPFYLRLIVHFLSAFWILFQLQTFQFTPEILTDPANLALNTGFLILIVWLLNLYNFMDGIDAITGSETITVGLAIALLAWLLMPQDPSWMIVLLLVASVAGFQIWNMPPARLFMGDAGSAFLGLVFGALVLHTFHQSQPLFYAWLIMLGVYIVDATFTLTRRILAGEKFYQAHRSHAYQHASIQYRSHGRISLSIAAINLIWLFPFASAAAFQLLPGPVCLTIGYLPLVAIAVHFKAGISVSPHQNASRE